jgi:type I restriction enzyme, S subunit
MEKQQSKKPLVRFPEFKDAWEHKRLNELLSEAKKRNEDLKYGKDEVLSVSGELGIVNQIEHLGRSYAGVSVHQYHVVEVGDIVYTKSPLKANPFGIIKLNKGKAGIVSTLYAVYKVNQQTAYGPFIDYYFSLDANTNRYLRPLVKKGAKNDMKINNAYVLHDRIFAPAIPEQKRIASFFTVLDKKIAELKQKKNLLEQYKKGVMQKLFSQELRFKDENGKDFPKWEKKPLGELLDYIQPTKYLVESTEYDDSYETPVLTAGKSFILGYTNETFGIYNEQLPVIIFDDFTTAIQFVDFPFKAKSSAMKLLVPKNNSNIYFIFEAMQLIEYAIGGHERHWISKFAKIEIPVPCPEEQNRISDFLNSVNQKLAQTENQLHQTQQYKKGLLQNMFI